MLLSRLATSASASLPSRIQRASSSVIIKSRTAARATATFEALISPAIRLTPEARLILTAARIAKPSKLSG